MKTWLKRSFFFPEENSECLANFEVFNDNEFLETSSDLDDSEISLLIFIEQNRNVNTTKRTKTDLNAYGNDGASALGNKGHRRNSRRGTLQSFMSFCLSKSGNGTRLFSGAVFNKCTIVVGQICPPLSLRCVVIDSDEDD